MAKKSNRTFSAKGRTSCFRGDNAPALIPLVADAGIEREHILTGIRKTAAVGLADLKDIRHLIGARPQLGGQLDPVPNVQRVELPEVAVGAAVMGGEADIALPDRGVLKMADALGERLTVRSLIDPHIQIQRGDLQSAKGAVFVVEVVRHLREQHRGLIAAAAHRAARGDAAGGTAANDRTGRGNTTGGQIWSMLLVLLRAFFSFPSRSPEKGIKREGRMPFREYGPRCVYSYPLNGSGIRRVLLDRQDCRSQLLWVEQTLHSLRPFWWTEREDRRALANDVLKTRAMLQSGQP